MAGSDIHDDMVSPQRSNGETLASSGARMPRLKKEREVKDDNRYIIFYTSEDESEDG